jgi:hypothetical protein
MGAPGLDTREPSGAAAAEEPTGLGPPRRSVRFSDDGTPEASASSCAGACTLQRGARASHAMEYSWAGRGPLPPEVAAASSLAAAFGPEPEEQDSEEGSAAAAAAATRIQIGDALVALLERHRSHRCGASRVRVSGAPPPGPPALLSAAGDRKAHRAAPQPGARAAAPPDRSCGAREARGAARPAAARRWS